MSLPTPTAAGGARDAATGWPNRHRPRSAVWLLPVGLLVVTLAVAGVAQVHRATSQGASWPQRIQVGGRSYDRAGPVSKADFAAAGSRWRQVATVGPDRDPVFAEVIPGAAATAVTVRLPDGTTWQYALVGGP